MEALAEVYGGPVDFKPSIFAAIERGLLQDPNAVAAIVRHQPGNHLAELLTAPKEAQDGTHGNARGRLQWTYAQIHQAAAGLATGLMEKGVSPGSIVATFIPNGIEYLLLLWAAALGRFGLANLDAGALNEARAEELDYYVSAMQPAAIIVLDDKSIPAIVRSLGQEKAAQMTLITLETTSVFERQPRTTSFVELCRPAQEADLEGLSEAARNDTPDRTSFVLFTSGTSSGKPKGVPKDVKSMVFSIEGQGWTKPGEEIGNRLLTTTNFRTIAPILVYRAWRDGATVVIPGASFTPTATLDAIEYERITTVILIPAMIHSMIAHSSFGSRDLSSLRMILSGGDMVTRALVDKSKKHFPSAGFLACSGMTEGSALTQWAYWDLNLPAKYYSEIASLGGVTKGTRLRIVENGRVVKRGQAGELHCMNDSMLKQYVGGENPESFYTDDYGQWFKTGDLALIDSDGDLYIVGRMKDVIKRSGVSVIPSAIESALNAFANSQTAVLATTHEVLGHEPFAILEAFNGKTEDQLKDRVVEVFGKDYALAGAIELKDLGLSEMPQNESNKVNKIALRQPLSAFLKRKKADSV